MKSSRVRFSAAKTWLILAMVAGSVASPMLQAQQVYRIVGPDGKVTFSDRPPVAATTGASAKTAQGTASAAAAAPTGLPFELRQVALKYPVVLYTSDNCAPCGAGRSMLTSRGIPFSEKTVATAEDASALQRLSGESSLPFMTIGAQQLKGYSDAEWTQFLDAAGYPKSSVLPSSYRPPAAAPLVAIKEAPAATPAGSNGTPAKAAGGAPAPIPVQAAPANPAGIKF
ncbi:MAG: glutaredoxin [Polaromonas sp.]|nr:glutaredoxin [Polaromonas sp.]